MSEIYSISTKIDFNDLTYYFKCKDITLINFVDFRCPLRIYESIKKWFYISNKSKRKSKTILKNLNEIKKENPKK